MNRLLCWMLLAAIFVHRALAIPTITETPDDDDDDWEDEDDSSAADDDSRIYKNPRNSPSAECPRDEEQATLLGQKCLRKCSSDEDCKSKKKKCLCDGACGMSCIKPDRECPELEQPSLGAVSVSSRHFGGRATYTCPHGYHVVGLQSRLCQADGHWAGAEPACKQNIYCLTPPTIDHARHSALPEQATFDLESTIQYSCHTGYVTNGFPRAKCLAIDGQASWYGPDIQCEPRSCGQPPDPAHGWHAGECYTFGCRVSYHCSEGYELVGKQERFCQADGSWTPKELPTCVLVTSVQCPTPENPKNGRAIYTSVSYNSVVSYDCRYGYTLIGESSRKCGADKRWSGTTPACKEINCGHPGNLYNGWLENIESGTGLGASLIYRCHPGMMLVGNTSTVCQIDGIWRYPLPQCLAPCIVPSIMQGTVTPIPVFYDSELNDTTTTTIAPVGPISKVIHGTTLSVICDRNYEFPMAYLAPPTCNNGTWSIIPKCVPARCKGLPKPPKNGMVLAPKTEHGMKAKFKCKDGYNMTGIGGKEITNLNDYVLTCSFGIWTGETPECHELYCAYPGNIDHGKVFLVGNMGLYDYRPYVKKIVNNKQIMYDCDKGYILAEGPPGATCVAGLWRPTNLPLCLPGQHPRLRWNRKRRSLSKRIMALRADFLIPKDLRKRRVYPTLQPLVIPTIPFPDNRTNKDFIDLSYSSELMLEDEPASEEEPYKSRITKIVPRLKRSANYPSNPYADHDKKYRQIIMERAYIKYYDTLRRRYRVFLNKLLTANKNKTSQSETTMSSAKNGKLVQNMDTKSDKNNNSDMPTRYLKSGSSGKDYVPGEEVDYLDYEILRAISNNNDTKNNETVPIAIPNINENIQKEVIENTYPEVSVVNNTIIVHQKPVKNYRKWKTDFDNYFSETAELSHHALNREQSRPNTTSIISQLNSLIAHRRRRDVENQSDTEEDDEITARTDTATVGTVNDTTLVVVEAESTAVDTMDLSKRGKPKEPCQPILAQPHFRMEIVRQGKDPDTPFSAGTIVKVICNKEYKLNLLNPNGTAKCVRGRWKPMTPECILLPCTVPSTDHGSYFAITSDPLMSSNKPNTTLLSAYDDIENGKIIAFQCDEGFNTLGPSQLRCAQGNWAVAALPECIAAPCLLPPINNAVYQGGYRSGLTIAHGSSVSVQCEGPSGNGPVQMVCALGNLSPQTVQCGSGTGKRSRDEYLVEVEFVSTNNNEILNTLDGIVGKNIVDQTALIMKNRTLTGGKDCGPPIRVNSSLVYSSDPFNETEEIFPSGTEITFNCIPNAANERSTWKLFCEDGEWVGRAINCVNGTCLFVNDEPNVISFYNDLEIREETVDFPPGAVIVSRCVDIGKFSMSGSTSRTCIHSEWEGQKPICNGLNQENDYAMEKAPTILFRYSNGTIAQSNDGKLIVYPGTTLHMECLWMRRFGNPKWDTSHKYRNYSEGWVTEDGRDAQLEYRLSIIEAVERDTGSYTCETPARHGHTINVVVKAVHCPEIQTRRGIILSANDTRLGTKVQLSCANGNSLIGASELVCLPSGNWSAPLPVCESVECGDIPLPNAPDAPRVSILSREVGGRAAFSCPSGFGLDGPSESICNPSGEWTLPFPTCSEVQCQNPGAPANGYAQGSAPYRAGDVLQFNCNPEYMMQGQPIIACQDSGRWSGALPKCVQACSYPGTAISGRMSIVKFYYAIGENVTFTCDAGLELRGAKLLKCLRNGKWSSAIPTCVNSELTEDQNAEK